MRVIALLTFFLIFSARDVLALSLSFSGAPEQIDRDQEFEINISLSCQSCSDSYFRAVFYKEGSTNYFGYTQNEKGDWVNTTSDKSLYYHLTQENVVEGSWSGKLKAKPDPGHSSYTGSGSYLFKVGRYTSPTSGATWSENIVTIYIASPIPTPSSTPTPILKPTVIPSPTLSPPTPTPPKTSSPPKNPTISSTVVLTPTKKEIATSSASVIASASAILSASDSANPIEKEKPTAINSETLVREQMGSLTLIGILASTILLLAMIYRRIKLLSISAKVK